MKINECMFTDLSICFPKNEVATFCMFCSEPNLHLRNPYVFDAFSITATKMIVLFINLYIIKID